MMEDRIIKTTTRGDGEVLVRTTTQSCCAPYITYLRWPGRRIVDWPVFLSGHGSFTEAEALIAHAELVDKLDARLAAITTETA